MKKYYRKCRPDGSICLWRYCVGDKARFLTLRQVAEDLGMSYRATLSAAHKGRLPAFQPFGTGTTWCVSPDYRKFLGKSRRDEDNNPAGAV